MNNYNKICILFFLAITTLFSCEDFFDTNIDIDPPSFEKKLAIVGKATSGASEIVLKLTESIGVLEDDSLLIGVSGAEVTALVNNIRMVVIETQTRGNNGRLSPQYVVEIPQKLKGGDLVKIEANYKNLPIATVESRVPYSPIFENIKLTKDAGKDADGNDISKLVFNYKSQESSIYLAGYFENRSIYCSAAQSSNGVYTCLKMDTNYYQDAIIFQDPEAIYNNYLKKSNIDQTSKELVVTFSKTLFQNSPNGNTKPFLFFETHTKDGYDFLVSLRNYSDSGENPFATPVNIKSNVKNGYGILLLSTNTRLEL